MDPLREARRRVERLLDVARHLVDEPLRACRVRLEERTRELQVDRERDQVLLDTLVQRALDRAAVRVGGEDEPTTRRTQLVELTLQPFDGSLQLLDG